MAGFVGRVSPFFGLQWGDVDWHNNLLYVRREFLPALSSAGLRRIRFHDLRHTYTTLLIAQGENIKFIQSQLGHASIEMTLDRYGHLLPDAQHGVGERLDGQIFGFDPVPSSNLGAPTIVL